MKTRRILLFIIAVLTLSVASQPAARAQRGNATYAQPAKFPLKALLKKDFPEYYGKAFPQEQLIIEEFYPIGWSKDGKFAYYAEPGDEACGCYFGQLHIVDLVNDKLLWSFDYNGQDHEDEKNAPKSINDLWRANRKLFSDKLREYAIVPQGRFALLDFPANYSGDQLSPELKVKVNTNEETRYFSGLVEARLDLVSKQRGKKTVFEQTYLTGKKEYESSPLALKLVGYLQSPFEPRVATVLIEVWRGYEGPPHTTHLKIVGASLTSGFK